MSRVNWSDFSAEHESLRMIESASKDAATSVARSKAVLDASSLLASGDAADAIKAQLTTIATAAETMRAAATAIAGLANELQTP